MVASLKDVLGKTVSASLTGATLAMAMSAGPNFAVGRDHSFPDAHHIENTNRTPDSVSEFAGLIRRDNFHALTVQVGGGGSGGPAPGAHA